jgi:hypothetical protein
VTAASLKQLAGTLGAQLAPTGPFDLSPGKPGVKDRGYLDWFHPANVNGKVGSESSRFDGGVGHLIVGLKAAAGGKFLITCGIQATAEPQTFTINRLESPNADAPLGTVAKLPGENLLWAVQAVSAGWNTFTLSSADDFMLYWCSVAPLG